MRFRQNHASEEADSCTGSFVDVSPAQSGEHRRRGEVSGHRRQESEFHCTFRRVATRAPVTVTVNGVPDRSGISQILSIALRRPRSPAEICRQVLWHLARPQPPLVPGSDRVVANVGAKPKSRHDLCAAKDAIGPSVGLS